MNFYVEFCLLETLQKGPYDIYEEIMQSELKFPEFIYDKKAKKLI